MIPTNKKVVTEQTSQNTNITNLQNNKVDKVSGKALSTNDFTNAYKTKIDNMFSLIYPVGSIYMSVNSTSPATLFGGTWEQIKDKFLLSTGNSYANGSTGGSATHTIAVGNLPTHTHTYSNATAVQGHTLTIDEMPEHSHSFGMDLWANKERRLYA